MSFKADCTHAAVLTFHAQLVWFLSHENLLSQVEPIAHLSVHLLQLPAAIAIGYCNCACILCNANSYCLLLWTMPSLLALADMVIAHCYGLGGFALYCC